MLPEFKKVRGPESQFRLISVIQVIKLYPSCPKSCSHDISDKIPDPFEQMEKGRSLVKALARG